METNPNSKSLPALLNLIYLSTLIKYDLEDCLQKAQKGMTQKIKNIWITAQKRIDVTKGVNSIWK